MREIPYQTERAPHTRVDPAYAPSVEVFDNLTHQEIHGKVQLLDPAAIDAGRQAWQSSATGLTDSVAQAHNEIRSTIADGWRGGAAQTAADAVRDFEQRGQQIADVMATVAQRLGQAGDAAETLRSAVGSPSGAEPDLAAALLDPNQATGNIVAQKATEHDRQDVVQAMDSIYTNAFLQSGSGVPAFPDDTPVIPAGITPSAAGLVTAPALPADAAQSPGAQPVSALTALPATTVETAQETKPQPDGPPATDTTPATVTSAAGPLATPPAADTVPAAAKTVPVAADSPAATAPSAPDRTPRPGVSAPVGAASTALPGATFPGSSASSTDDQRKREERRKDANSEAVTGMGAGAVGGLMGGAIAAADTTRHGSSVASKAAAARAEDEDDELHWIDDDLTFLEPADETGELIGELDPTTPPVVGEWTELE
ncbi:PPE domain-containing protein [Nocardia sp. bgisy134]|uniref:WXG100 family type VII secretion target n=1 Tax=unclassified Nocardia TaxID=2637762 RepID=UPI003D71D573